MADDDWTKTTDPVHTWGADNPRPPLLDETVPGSPNAPATTMTTPALPPAGGGFGRDLAVGGTRALGTAGDMISDIKPYVLDPVVNYLHNSLGIPTGPEIPIPNTENVRSGLGVAPPQNREERIADDIGEGVGVVGSTMLGSELLRAGTASARALGVAVPTLRVGGRTALSLGAGATSGNLAQEYFPDSLAMQLIASALGGFGSAAIARRLLGGSLPAVTTGLPHSLPEILGHEYLGRLAGAGAGWLLGGGHESALAEVGGLAGIIGGRWAAPYIRYAFSPAGMQSAVTGTVGGLPGAVADRNNQLNWQNQVTDPMHRGGLQQP